MRRAIPSLGQPIDANQEPASRWLAPLTSTAGGLLKVVQVMRNPCLRIHPDLSASIDERLQIPCERVRQSSANLTTTLSSLLNVRISLQQYLHKNPGGYCGLGGTGVSCPVGVDA